MSGPFDTLKFWVKNWDVPPKSGRLAMMPTTYGIQREAKKYLDT